MSDQERYDSRYLNGYRRTLSGYEFARWKALHHFIKKILDLHQIENLLDYGCGNGLYAELWLKLFPRASLCFADISPVALNQLAGKYSQYAKNCSLIEHDKTQYPDNFFEVVVSIEVMEHVRDLKAYLKEIHRLVKPGGAFIWTTPCANILSVEHIYSRLTHQIVCTPEGFRKWSWEDPEHLRRLKSEEIKNLLMNEIGFSEIKFRFRAHLFSFICTKLFTKKFKSMGEKLMLLDYTLFKHLPNGASMLGCAIK